MSAPRDVVIVDDSAICRSRLREIVEADGDLRVAGELSGGQDVVPFLQRLQPAVLLTDLVMPDRDGLQVVREVMRQHPLPTIIVSGGGFNEVSAFDAIRFGALEVAAKPEAGDHAAEAALRDTIRRVSTVPVIRHPGTTSRPPRPTEPPSFRRLTHRGKAPVVVGIGASAGGPPAVVALLEALARDTPLSVLVAQHMPRDHAHAFARFLAQRCPLEVVVCSGTAPLRPGVVLVPDDGCDLVVTSRERAASISSRSSLTPSVDALLESLALHVGREAAGVVLSGIGHDGTAGLSALQAAEGLTIAQDERSSAVFGMPKAAATAARHHLPPREIGKLLAESTTPRQHIA